MAFFDDRRFLLSHIRHSFITCDDTGMCEMVMLNEAMPHRFPSDDPSVNGLPENLDLEVSSELLEGAQSYDIVSDIEMIGAHRRRSNTWIRLDRLKKERKTQSKVKVIHWKDNADGLTGAQMEEMFPRKEPQGAAATAGKPIKKSVLSAQLEKYPCVPNNPFNEFARFDGRVSEGAPTKRILIFLTMAVAGPSPDHRSTPLEVVSLSSARVQDLIGLICWLYSNEGREPKLKPSVGHYCLRIAEENGDMDPDFPSLNPKEPVLKFGFPVLALVERELEEDEGAGVVTVHIDEMFSKIQLPSVQVSLQWIRDQTLRKRRTTFHGFSDARVEYTLQKFKEPGVKLDLSRKLSDVDTREFRLVSGSPSSSSEEEGEPGTDEAAPKDMLSMFAIEAPLYKSYNVSAVQKLGRNAEIQLGISGKKVDINPVQSKNSSKLLFTWQPKAASYNVESIAECELVAQKHSTGRASFKLVCHTGAEFESQRFEADSRTVQEIVKKLKYIMQMRSSSVRTEYAELKEARQQKKGIHHRHFPGFQ